MTQSHHDWLSERPFSLLLGAGFFGFYAHTGLLAALEAHDLRPRRIAGVSAGALAGGLWAAGHEAAAIQHELGCLERRDFWDPGLPIGGLLRGRKFKAKLRTLLTAVGVSDVEHCRTPFAAVAHDVLGRRPIVLEQGPLDVAILASCAVPLLFRPLVVGGRLLVDGGISDRSGWTAMGDRERVLFHHLPHTQPWSRLRSKDPLHRTETRAIVTVPNLPPVNPFALEPGMLALERTREHTLRWLESPRAEIRQP